MVCRSPSARRLNCVAWICLLSAGGGGSALGRAAEPIVLAEDLELYPVVAGVWRHVSWAKLPGSGLTPANGLVVIDGSEVALIDTPWDDGQTAMLLDWADREKRATRHVVVVGHAHQDCLGGLAEAHARGAESYASALTVGLAKRHGDEVPRHAFTDTLTVRVGKRRLELRHAGAGHTQDNIVIWLPDARVLFGGCLVRSPGARNLGNPAEADPAAWLATVERLAALYPTARIVVPGHGEPGGPELLTHTADLARAAAAGQTAD